MAAGIATQIERMTRARRDALEDREIEVDRVPAREHVRIECEDAIAEGMQRLALVGTTHGLLGHVAAAAVDDQHFIDVRCVHRNRQQPLALRIGLDVERQHPRLDLDLRGPNDGIVEDLRRCSPAAASIAFDLAATLDAALYEISHGKANIGFEGIHAGGVQAVAHCSAHRLAFP